MIFKIIASILFVQQVASAWTTKDHYLYAHRHFIELSHLLIMQNQTELVRKIELQKRDFGGCKLISDGEGGIEALISCIRFINREKELGLTTPGRTRFIRDINILCKTLIVRPNALLEVIDSKALKGSVWSPCVEQVWRQVYLTVYANYEADSVGMLSLVRKVQESLKTKSLWANRTVSLFNIAARNL